MIDGLLGVGLAATLFLLGRWQVGAKVARCVVALALVLTGAAIARDVTVSSLSWFRLAWDGVAAVALCFWYAELGGKARGER